MANTAWIELIGLLLFCVLFLYIVRYSAKAPHRKEFGFTIALSVVSACSITIPLAAVWQDRTPGIVTQRLEGQQDSVKPPCFKAGVIIFGEGTDCDLPCPLLHDKKSRLDRFLAWEFVAILQTIFFALLLFFEMERVQFTKLTTFVALIVIPVAAVLAWHFLTEENWHYELICTFAFVAAVFFEDVLLWRQTWKALSSSKEDDDAFEIKHMQRIALAVDLPILISILILSLVAYNDNSSRWAQHFFAGGTAFSLILGNMSLLIHRFGKHLHEKKSMTWAQFLWRSHPSSQLLRGEESHGQSAGG